MWWVVAGLLSLLFSGLEGKEFQGFRPHTDHPFSEIQLDKASVEIDSSAHIEASPNVLGVQGETYEWVTVKYNRPSPAVTDWIAAFSPANFNSSTCTPESGPNDDQTPLLCSAPIKFQYANYSTVNYSKTGKGSLKLRLINQRADFAFALFAGGLSNPKLLAISNTISFANPKAPLYPRLAQGKLWNEMTVTWASGYGIEEGTPVVEWGFEGEVSKFLSAAGTLTYTRNMMCGVGFSYALRLIRVDRPHVPMWSQMLIAYSTRGQLMYHEEFIHVEDSIWFYLVSDVPALKFCKTKFPHPCVG